MQKITGTLIKNYFHCKRQAYLYSKGLNFENDYTKIGEIQHEEKQMQEYVIENVNLIKYNLKIESIKIDKINFENKTILEYKKSSANLEGSTMQLLFYLYILDLKGLKFKGILKDIDFNCSYDIELNKENREKLESLFQQISKLIYNSKIPGVKKTKSCNNCSFNDYCFS